MEPILAPFNAVKTCRHSLMLYNVNDQYIGRSLDLYGEFSEGEIDLFRQLVHPGQTVLDIGANIGAHTVFLARQVGPTGRVLAFEPQRLVFQALCANIALNSLTNTWCWQQALGAQPGHITVPGLDPHRANNFGGLSLADNLPGERVPIATVDGLELGVCHLVKIDVEGMEIEVLRGAVQTLARCRPYLYVENDRVERSDALIRLIDSLGYRLFWHRPPLFNPNNFFGNPQNVFGQIVSLNMLCLPREASVSLQGFEEVAVPGAADGGGKEVGGESTLGQATA